MSEELKIKIPVLVDDSDAAKGRFQRSITKLAKGMKGANAPKIEITVSKINGQTAINTFKQQIEAAIGAIGKTEVKPKITINAKAWKAPYAQKQDISPTYNIKPYKDLMKLREIEHNKQLQREQDAELAAQKKRESEAEQLSKKIDKFQNTSGVDTKIVNAEKTIQMYRELGYDVTVTTENVEKLRAAQLKCADAIKSNDSTEITNSFNALDAAIKNVDNSTSKLGKSRAANTSHNKEQASLHNLILEMQTYDKLNSKFRSDSGLSFQFNDLAGQSKRAFDAGDFSSVNEYEEQWKSLQGAIKSASLEGQNFGTKLKQQFEKLGVYLSASAVIMQLGKAIKDTVKTVVELDGVVTDLQIATGGTRKETQELLKTYSAMGKELGATTVDVGKAADAWLRQGYSVAQTNALIKNSMMLSKLGQIDSAESTKALTSAMKGYKLSVEDVSGVVDKFTAIDLKAATSAGEIATAMAEVSTSARLAGVDIDKLSGYLAVVSEVSQDAPESVGTFYRTLFARMGNIKAGNLIDPEDSSSLSDVESVLSGLDIKLRSSKGEFRNFGEVLDEVASKWGNYGTVNQNAIAVAFAG